VTTFEHSVVIARPIGQVWAYVTDAGNNPVWQGPMLEVRRGACATMAIGTQIEEGSPSSWASASTSPSRSPSTSR